MLNNNLQVKPLIDRYSFKGDVVNKPSYNFEFKGIQQPQLKKQIKLTPEARRTKIQNDLKKIRQQKYTKTIGQAQPEKKEGILTSILKEPLKLGARYALTTYQTGKGLYELAKLGFKSLDGLTEEEKQQFLEKTKNIGQPAKTPFLGEIKPLPKITEPVKMTGVALETAPYFMGGAVGKDVVTSGLKGKFLQAAKTGLKEAPIGAMFGAGVGLQEEKPTVGRVATQAAVGGVAGGVLGATLPLAGGLVKGGVKIAAEPLIKRIQPVEKWVLRKVEEGVNKGIKPYFSGKRLGIEHRKNYLTKAFEAIKTISENKPLLENEEGVLIKRNPQNRVELLEAINQTKNKLFEQFDNLANEAGEAGAKFNAKPVIEDLTKVVNNKAHSPKVRKYAADLIDEIAELEGATPKIVQGRIRELNESLSGYYAGRVEKAKARIDASVANKIREELDKIITNITGKAYQPLRNKYAALKTIEKDVARQVAVELRKNKKGLLDFTDIFTGADLLGGALTGNPAMILRGAVGRGIKAIYKKLNDPNKYIKGMFEAVEKLPKRQLIEEVKPTFKPAGLLPEPKTIPLAEKVPRLSAAKSRLLSQKEATEFLKTPPELLKKSRQAVGILPKARAKIKLGRTNLTTVAEDAKIIRALREGKNIIIDPDRLKKAFNDYNPAHHEKYSQIAKEFFKKALVKDKNKVVKFTAGGSGSGKSAALLKKMKKGFDGIIVDGVLANKKSAFKKIDQVLASGKTVEINAVIPDLATARKYTLLREAKTGRGIPIDVFAEKHAGVPETLRAIVEKYPYNKVKIKILDARNVFTKEGLIKTPLIKNRKAMIDLLKDIKYNKDEIVKRFKNKKLEDL